MTEYTPEKVADIAAWLLREHGSELSPLGRNYTDAEMADALTAVSAERDRLDESFDRDLPWRYSEMLEQVKTMRTDRDRLHKAITEALDHDPLHGRPEGLHCGGMSPCIHGILRAALDKEGNDDE